MFLMPRLIVLLPHYSSARLFLKRQGNSFSDTGDTNNKYNIIKFRIISWLVISFINLYKKRFLINLKA
jgi:hypothetical protein